MSNQVDLYIYKMGSAVLPEPAVFLDSAELSNFEKMVSTKRKNEYLHSRFLIKKILQQEYKIKNPQIRFNRHGKPTVRGIKFNISHSAETIVVAISKNFSLGVDVEQTGPKKHYLDIAKTYFSAQEFKYILAVKSESQRQARFRHLWSLKEAAIKAFDGVLTSKSIQIYFDLKTNTVDKNPWPKSLLFFLNKKQNIALCVSGASRSCQLNLQEVSLNAKGGLKLKLSRAKFLSIFQ